MIFPIFQLPGPGVEPSFLTVSLRCSLAASLLVLARGGSPAPAQNKGQTLSEAEARKDADHAVQGEYVGKRTAGDDEGKVR